MDTIQVDYDNVLIGSLKTVDSSNFYGSSPGGPSQQRAVSCIKYALEKILEWDVETSIKKFDSYIIKIMKLERLVEYIDFPIEVPHGNPRYILSLLYPSRIKLNQQKLVEEIFESVLNARKNNDDEDNICKEIEENNESNLGELQGKQFPREYFSGSKGFYRFCFCIKYLLENYKPIGSVEEIYNFFDSPDGKKFLYDYRLKVPADQFSISMHDVIYCITKNQPDSDFYHAYYAFLQEFKSTAL